MLTRLASDKNLNIVSKFQNLPYHCIHNKTIFKMFVTTNLFKTTQFKGNFVGYTTCKQLRVFRYYFLDRHILCVE